MKLIIPTYNSYRKIYNELIICLKCTDNAMYVKNREGHYRKKTCTVFISRISLLAYSKCVIIRVVLFKYIRET